jgi:FkbM family methyltransferase
MTQKVRYALGAAVRAMQEALLSAHVLPLSRAVPFGISPWYDVQRIIRTRHVELIFDVGANVGQTAKGLRKYFPDAQIHCFEPASEPFASLDSLTRDWPNVTAHRLALGKETGMADMMVASGEQSELNTLVVDAERKLQLTGCEQVRVDTVDRFCATHGIDSIDILKADVQGWELQLLEGAASIIDAGQVRFLFLEVSFMSDSRDMVPFADVHAFVTDRGYVLSGLYDFFRWGNKAEVYFANALYVQSRLARSP